MSEEIIIPAEDAADTTDPAVTAVVVAREIGSVTVNQEPIHVEGDLNIG